MKAINIYSGNILLDEKINQNILIYNISYNTFMSSKPLCIWFNKTDGLVKIYDGSRYLVILGHSWFDEIWDSIKYLINEKSCIANSIDYNFARIRIDYFKSDNSLPIEKISIFHNIKILIKPVVNKNENYYYNIFLEKGWCKNKSNTQYFKMNVCILYPAHTKTL